MIYKSILSLLHFFFLFQCKKTQLVIEDIEDIPSAVKIADRHSESENQIIQHIPGLCKLRSTILSAAPTQLTSGILSGLLVIQLTSADK